MKAAPNRIAEFKPREPAILVMPLFTKHDLRDLEQRVKTDCYKAHRIEMRKVRRRCYAILSTVAMSSLFAGFVLAMVAAALFPAL